jgi:hypothetical protein
MWESVVEECQLFITEAARCLRFTHMETTSKKASALVKLSGSSLSFGGSPVLLGTSISSPSSPVGGESMPGTGSDGASLLLLLLLMVDLRRLYNWCVFATDY